MAPPCQPCSLPTTVNDLDLCGDFTHVSLTSRRETCTVSWLSASCCIIIQGRWLDVLLSWMFKLLVIAVSALRLIPWSLLLFGCILVALEVVKHGPNHWKFFYNLFWILKAVLHVLLLTFCQLRHCVEQYTACVCKCLLVVQYLMSF